MAPEVILGINHGYSIDYYAIGVITFELFFQRRPHTSLTYDELAEEIISKDIDFASCPELQTISKAAADFIIQVVDV
jgi:serine/threonine protein kinase